MRGPPPISTTRPGVIPQALRSARRGGAVALLGLAVLYVGLKRDLNWLRLVGFGLFGLALAKLFLYGLACLSSITRALSFLAVGAVLLVAGGFIWSGGFLGIDGYGYGWDKTRWGLLVLLLAFAMLRSQDVWEQLSLYAFGSAAVAALAFAAASTAHGGGGLYALGAATIAFKALVVPLGIAYILRTLDVDVRIPSLLRAPSAVLLGILLPAFPFVALSHLHLHVSTSNLPPPAHAPRGNQEPPPPPPPPPPRPPPGKSVQKPPPPPPPPRLTSRRDGSPRPARPRNQTRVPPRAAGSPGSRPPHRAVA